MLRFVSGSIFDSDVQTLVNPVNRVGVSGAGLAKEFKKRFPRMQREYERACLHRRMGDIVLYRTQEPLVLCFVTKEHWRNPSELGLIENGLAEFVREYTSLGISSIAFPALGCGNGGLDWLDVRLLMTHYLEQVEIPVAIHVPPEAPGALKKEVMR